MFKDEFNGFYDSKQGFKVVWLWKSKRQKMNGDFGVNSDKSC